MNKMDVAQPLVGVRRALVSRLPVLATSVSYWRRHQNQSDGFISYVYVNRDRRSQRRVMAAALGWGIS